MHQLPPARRPPLIEYQIYHQSFVLALLLSVFSVPLILALAAHVAHVLWLSTRVLAAPHLLHLSLPEHFAHALGHGLPFLLELLLLLLIGGR